MIGLGLLYLVVGHNFDSSYSGHSSAVYSCHRITVDSFGLWVLDFSSGLLEQLKIDDA